MSNEHLLHILVCPVCKSSLTQRTSNELVCEKDQLSFPIRDGIPVMLREYADPIPPED